MGGMYGGGPSQGGTGPSGGGGFGGGGGAGDAGERIKPVPKIGPRIIKEDESSVMKFHAGELKSLTGAYETRMSKMRARQAAFGITNQQALDNLTSAYEKDLTDTQASHAEFINEQFGSRISAYNEGQQRAQAAKDAQTASNSSGAWWQK